MTRIDWYILKQLLVTFIFCMLLFTVIAVAVDSSEKTDDFVKTGLGTSEIIQQYYFGFVPYIWGLLFPLFVFIAVIFFTSRLAARSEIIAILASGTSFFRLMRPYLIGGTFLAIILWLAGRFIIPKANEIRSSFQTFYFDKNDPSKNRGPRSHHMQTDTNTYMSLAYFDERSGTGGSFSLQKIDENKVIYNLRAETLRWDSVKKNWQLINVTERIVDSMKESVRAIPQMNIVLNAEPKDLRRDEYLKDKLSTPELIEFIRWQELRGAEGLNTLKVERYRRTATPFTVLILTMIGAVVASRKTRGGSGVHLALGIVIAVFFIVSDRFSTVFSTKGNFHPLLAVWLPNIVFTGILIWLYRRAPK